MADQSSDEERVTTLRECASVEATTKQSGDVCAKNDPKYPDSFEQLIHPPGITKDLISEVTKDAPKDDTMPVSDEVTTQIKKDAGPSYTSDDRTTETETVSEYFSDELTEVKKDVVPSYATNEITTNPKCDTVPNYSSDELTPEAKDDVEESIQHAAEESKSETRSDASSTKEFDVCVTDSAAAVQVVVSEILNQRIPILATRRQSVFTYSSLDYEDDDDDDEDDYDGDAKSSAMEVEVTAEKSTISTEEVSTTPRADPEPEVAVTDKDVEHVEHEEEEDDTIPVVEDTPTQELEPEVTPDVDSTQVATVEEPTTVESDKPPKSRWKKFTSRLFSRKASNKKPNSRETSMHVIKFPTEEANTSTQSTEVTEHLPETSMRRQQQDKPKSVRKRLMTRLLLGLAYNMEPKSKSPDVSMHVLKHPTEDANLSGLSTQVEPPTPKKREVISFFSKSNLRLHIRKKGSSHKMYNVNWKDFMNDRMYQSRESMPGANEM